jgi:hypothetical protein
LEIGPSFCLPPVESWRGTIPIQAAKSRPDRNTVGSGAVATIAVAPRTPMPGIQHECRVARGVRKESSCHHALHHECSGAFLFYDGS